jgi:hypothetical protein
VAYFHRNIQKFLTIQQVPLIVNGLGFLITPAKPFKKLYPLLVQELLIFIIVEVKEELGYFTFILKVILLM